MTTPETVLQFGTGKFLRAFADWFIDRANQTGQDVGRVVAVQSTGDNRAALLNQSSGRYPVWIRGTCNGETIDRVDEVRSISRALHAGRQWAEVLEVARSPNLRMIVSNTSETGYELHDLDRPEHRPPRSFPAKLTLVLYERFVSGQNGVDILPCELFEENAGLLLQMVCKLVHSWGLPARFEEWLKSRCRWRNTLVDRITVSTTSAGDGPHDDPLLAVAEPYALWAIQTRPTEHRFFDVAGVLWTEDVGPYFLRKVRILNAAHTAMLAVALPRGMETVRQAVSDPEIAGWLERLIFDEIVPVLDGRVEAPAAFGREVLERFRNPFLEHRLRDIAAYHEAKVKIRLVPTREEFIARFGRRPALLDQAITAAVQV